MNSRAIVLFTGDPKREGLRKGVPSRLLGTLHQHLIETIGEQKGTTLVVASERHGRFSLASEGVVVDDSSVSLGAKIASAFRFAFGMGSQSVLLLAGDVAGVDLPLLEEAFATLETNADRCVIGPSGDGGFYLLGLNQSGTLATSIEWNQIPWFCASTTSELIARASAHGARLAFVRSIDDIDCLTDVVRISDTLSSEFALLRSRLQSLIADCTIAPHRNIAFATSRPRNASLFRGPPPA